ncbi:uncharacterized protein [Macrobrachium rosenbergii]|uniref:uncharacterized protein n=1 Tax=Macrobrachium rosenbergii TaxID=79674 RepID=UPI0034D6D6A4
MGWSSVIKQASLLVIAVITPGITSIRISNMRVPKFLQVGSAGELDCSWEGESDNMYSIKWYQAANEFYRYTPTAKDPIQIFDLPTLDVDRQRSWGGSVRIANVTLGAAGPFYCEVSADGPTFHTTSNQAIIHVIDSYTSPGQKVFRAYVISISEFEEQVHIPICIQV